MLIERGNPEPSGQLMPIEISQRRQVGVALIQFFGASCCKLPRQTLDIPVKFPEGRYYFQCDPHAVLGMKGHLERSIDWIGSLRGSFSPRSFGSDSE